MKQTNNAIKFLVAQYRAIFKKAYFKGFTTAVALTAGLVAGAAQAEDKNLTDLKKVTEDTTIYGSGASGDQYKYLQLSGDGTLNHTLTLQGEHNQNDFSGSYIKSTNGDVTVSGNGSLVLELQENDNLASNLAIFASGDSASVNVDINSIEIKEGDLRIGASGSSSKATVSADKFIIGDDIVADYDGGTTDGNYSYIYLGVKTGRGGFANSGSVVLGDSGSTFDIKSDGRIAFTNTSGAKTINADSITVNGGKILTQAKSGDIVPGDNKIDTHSLSIAKEGQLIVGSGNALTINLRAEAEKSGTLTVDEKSNVIVDGTLTIEGGETTIAKGAKVYTTTTNDNPRNIIIGNASGKETTLNVDSSTIKSFLNGDKTVHAQAEKGGLTINSGSTLHFTDTGTVELTDFTGGVIDRKLDINSGSIISGKNLSVKSALAGEDTTHLELHSENLTLGSDSYKDDTALKFKTAVTKNITFKTASTKDSFTLQDNVILRSISGVDVPVADDGSIEGNVTVSGDKALTVDGGKYTDSYDITLNSGDLVVGTTNSEVNSSLSLTGDLKIDGGKANTITVESTGTGDKVKTATLDLTKANVGYLTDSNPTKLTKFIVSGSNALLKINGDDLTGLLGAASGTSGTAVVVSGGKVEVSGDLGTSAKPISASNINNETTASGGQIQFNGTVSGTLSADALYLKDGGTDKLSFGSGSIIVNNLNLTAEASNKNFDFEGGTLKVIKSITNTSNVDKLDINGGTLNLGYYDSASEKVIGGGSVGIENLNISSGSLNVYGSWNAKKLTTSNKGKISVSQYGTLSANTLEATAANSVDIANGGSLTINGIANTAELKDSGVKFAQDSIALSGKLVLGANVAEDITVSGSTVTSSGGISNGAINISGGTLHVEFGSDRTFNSEELGTLKTLFFGQAGTIDGTLNIGDGKIGNLDIGTADTNGRFDFDKVANVADVTENGITNNKLTDNAFTTTNGQNVGGTVGAIHVTSGQVADIKKSAGFVNSSTNKGFFVSAVGADGKDVAADIQFNGTKLSLENGGIASDITLGATSSLAIKATDDSKITKLDSINGGQSISIAGNTVVEGDLSTNEAVIDKSLKAQKATFASLSSTKAETAGSLDIAKDLTVSSSTEFAGDIKVAGKATFGSTNGTETTYLAGNNTFNEVVLNNSAEFDKGNTQATDLTVQKGNLEIIGGANVKVSGVLKANGHIIVGEDQGKNETESWESSAGYLTAKRVDLDTNSILIADPDFGKAASIVAIDKVGKETETATTAGGVLRGQVVAARNSIIALGVEDSKEENAIKALQDNFAPFYMDENGSLKSDEVGAIAFVGKALTVEADAKIVVDSKVTNTTYLARDTKATTEYNAKIDGSDIYIGSNSVLGIDEDALSKKAAAIHFNKDAASVYGEQGAKIVLTGQSIGTNGDIKLFTDNGKDAEAGVEIKGNDILVESLNGIFKTTLKKDETVSDINLSVDKSTAKHKLAPNTSHSTFDTLMAYATGDHNWESIGLDSHKEDIVHNGLATGVKFDGTQFVDAQGKVLDSKLYTYKTIEDKDGKITYEVYHARKNAFLWDDATNSNGSSTETVSRLGMYGGAAQAAIQASASSYNAISGQMGIGGSQFTINSAANGQGASFWLSPIYNSLDSDGLSTGGLKYGADVDLYGLALGGDFSVANGFKVGAMFNVGSGDADGNGAGAGVKNDFNYYGFGVYGGYSKDNFSVLADLTYTVVDNDIDSNTLLDKVSASLDTKALSVGVTAQYSIETGEQLMITPHAGVRFTNLDIDNYTVKGEKYGEFAYYDADKLNIFSIPVGVTIAKEFQGEAWTVKPSLDITLTGNFGDDEAKATTYWEGVENLSTEAYNEVLDNFTYGASLGLSATNGNFTFGTAVNYTGSSNTDGFGIKANLQYVF